MAIPLFDMQHFPGVVTTSRHLSGEPPHRICRTYNFRRTGHKWTIPDPGLAGIHYSPVQVMGSGMVRPPKASHWIQKVTPELVLQQRHFSSELVSCLSNVSLELREVSFASTCGSLPIQRIVESKGRERTGEARCSDHTREALGSSQV